MPVDKHSPAQPAVCTLLCTQVPRGVNVALSPVGSASGLGHVAVGDHIFLLVTIVGRGSQAKKQSLSPGRRCVGMVPGWLLSSCGLAADKLKAADGSLGTATLGKLLSLREVVGPLAGYLFELLFAANVS